MISGNAADAKFFNQQNAAVFHQNAAVFSSQPNAAVFIPKCGRFFYRI